MTRGTYPEQSKYGFIQGRNTISGTQEALGLEPRKPQTAVKGKFMVFEETELNDYLLQRGIEIIEFIIRVRYRH